MRFYQHIMPTDLAEIRCRAVWYIVMAWHFYVHTSVSSESLAEAVGSYVGGYPPTQHKRHFVDETRCVVEQIESFRSERLRRGGWNHGLCSKYTFSVLRAGRMEFCRERCNAKP